MTIDQDRLAAIRRDHDHQRPPLPVDRAYLLDAVETLEARLDNVRALAAHMDPSLGHTTQLRAILDGPQGGGDGR